MANRAAAREQTIAEIKRIALAQLATDGPDLSLRAVARELGMVSSAVYRYFASRDELLTALIIDGYRDLAEATERAERDIAPQNLLERWLALGRATRDWAVAQPHVYALLYGTPLAGYRAPVETIEPATRPTLVLMRILADGHASKKIATPRDRLPKAVRADVERIRAMPGFDPVPVTLLARGLTCWATLFGAISFELFGRYVGSIENLPEYQDHLLHVMAGWLGLE